VEEIPIVHRSTPGSILMPGQTIPLIFFENHNIELMRRIVKTNKTFGLVSKRFRFRGGGRGSGGATNSSFGAELAYVGTTAEIFEYMEPSELNGYTIKAKGRQRFRVLNTRRTVDGVLMAEIKILPEVILPDPMYEIRLACRDRLRPFPELDEDGEGEEEGGETTSRRASATADQQPSTSSATSSCALTRSPGMRQKMKRANKPEYLPRRTSYKLSKFNHLRTSVYGAPLTPFPNWVYEMYDAQILVERVHQVLGKLKLFSQTRVSIPDDPTELSFWVASNLPFEENHRLGLLRISCTITRLRLEISLIDKFNILCCRNCGQVIARQSDIFSMSKDGPQGAYVNTGGYVHETLTLYKVQKTYTEGEPQTHFSWFPGYAWEMLACYHCSSHLGWRFTVDPSHGRKLHPKKFYGLTRKSIRPKLELSAAAGTGTGSDPENEFEEEVVLGRSYD